MRGPGWIDHEVQTGSYLISLYRKENWHVSTPENVKTTEEQRCVQYLGH